MTSLEDQDLTTDAVPTPPRQEESESYKQVPMPDERECSSSEEELNDVKPEKTTPGKFPNCKDSSPSGAFATVINISNANGFHIGNNFTVVLGKQEKETKKTYKDMKKTELVRKLLRMDSKVTKKHILYLSGFIGEGWKDTFRRLNFSEAQIAQFYESHIASGLKEVIFQMLLDWIQAEADKAITKVLASALWESNQKEAVLKWSQKEF